jgi:hypothetical protein
MTTRPPNLTEARELVDFITEPGTLAKLAAANALEGIDFAGIRGKTLQVNWQQSLAGMESTSAFLKGVFLR